MFLLDDDRSKRLILPDRYGVDDIPVILQDKTLAANGSLEFELGGLSGETFGLLGDEDNGIDGQFVLVETGTENQIARTYEKAQLTSASPRSTGSVGWSGRPDLNRSRRVPVSALATVRSPGAMSPSSIPLTVSYTLLAQFSTDLRESTPEATPDGGHDFCLGFDTLRRDTPRGSTSLGGVWTPDHRKLVSIGRRIRGGITSHGFALNIDPDMSAFRQFTACRLHDVTMTSLRELAEEQGRPPPPTQRFATPSRNQTWALFVSHCASTTIR